MKLKLRMENERQVARNSRIWIDEHKIDFRATCRAAQTQLNRQSRPSRCASLIWDAHFLPRLYFRQMKPASNLEKIELYLKAIESGDFACIADLFSHDARMEQFPNRIYPSGIRSDFSKMAESFEKGRKLLSSQSYEVKSHVADGDKLSVEVLWTGTLALACGNLAIGSQMRAHSAMLFEFKDGKIVNQRNYDCFEPW